MVEHVKPPTKLQLPLIILAEDGLCLRLGLGNCRQEQGSEQRRNDDDHQQFNQREARSQSPTGHNAAQPRPRSEAC